MAIADVFDDVGDEIAMPITVQLTIECVALVARHAPPRVQQSRVDREQQVFNIHCLPMPDRLQTVNMFH